MAAFSTAPAIPAVQVALRRPACSEGQIREGVFSPLEFHSEATRALFHLVNGSAGAPCHCGSTAGICQLGSALFFQVDVEHAKRSDGLSAGRANIPSAAKAPLTFCQIRKAPLVKGGLDFGGPTVSYLNGQDRAGSGDRDHASKCHCHSAPVSAKIFARLTWCIGGDTQQPCSGLACLSLLDRS
jgi:hypothetical protein